MTDERFGDRLWQAIAALPAGSGVVFRHHSLPGDERAALAERVAASAHERGLTLAVSRDPGLARAVGALLVHNPQVGAGFRHISRSAHGADQARLACDAGADLIFLSPIFPTRSHPERQPLRDEEVRRILEASEVPVIALGGMNRARFSELERRGFYGWAGIDAWLGA
jgi:thiamine-phosphate pyrophosphorylase